MERRARDEALQVHNETAKGDFISRQKAEFETRSFHNYQSREIKRRAKERQRQAEELVNQRRQRLAALFREEEERLSVDICNTIETPMQKRARLQRELQGFREQKEREHKEDVERRLYLQWRENCDPLRKQISQALQREVIKERDEQVKQRDIERMEDDLVEAAYVEQVKKDVIAFHERERQEEMDRRMKQQRNKATWTAQIGQRHENLIREQQKDREEGLRFRRQNEEDIRRAREEAEMKRIQQEQRRRELDAMNQDQISRRRALENADKDLDLFYANKAKEELRKEQEDYLVKRLIENRKANRNRELLFQQMNRKKEEDDEAEAYIQQAADEANRKQDEAWRIDAEKRRRLLMDATRYQEYQMEERENNRIRQQQMKMEERKQLESELEEKRRRDQEEREERLMKIRNQNLMLRNQSEIKRMNELRRRQEEKDSVRAMMQEWADEEEKIKRELANPVSVGKRFRGFR
ncbi:coiled-coil domain-containing protein 11-like [Tritrichomonas foetus]|uniref:Cilia- and flagella-associated protein 53 n=1 Tax=Tritrichomonas foetus TaxID=1144522 RepID=A0A1J4L5V6_9EUKA|nr:coiled-coil domain-containing protein 11-like [Tritrichomonas foetus]|eukprot:OHT17396.1 coiled-coil domain-containing protein 11-like [Tritrichomonas foetus]